MKRRFWILTLCLLAVAGAWLFWPQGSRLFRRVPGDGGAAATAAAAVKNPAATNAAANAALSAGAQTTNKLALRLSNTTNSLNQLMAARHAILLANAFIDTEARLDLKIPSHLRSAGDPGAYIVQARGAVDAGFRAALAAAGAQIVSYIPNNAYLVRLTAGQTGALAGNPLVQTVLPYEPYYKISSSVPTGAKRSTASVSPSANSPSSRKSLLALAVAQSPLPPGTALNLGLFAADAAATENQIEKLGAKIIGRDRSAFGPVLRVLAPKNWTALAQVPGVQILEPASARASANDLSRVTAGVSADTQTTSNYLNLSGSNVWVAVNDSSIDATHPDLTNRVFGAPADLTDLNGHGTHVAGIIAGDGTKSTTVTNAEGSIMPGTTNQFRGKAPLAKLFSINFGQSDYTLQTNAALVGALISNNSWGYGDAAYDLAAASYDAATRDALPGTTGSQPVLFVFAAGNSGGGNDDGAGGSGDTILSPGTAKNVITVGALEQPRNITNIVTTITDGQTNQVAYWQAGTDSGAQVAAYSSRGNVGIGTEGDYGRFKPDVISPGTFVVSTRSGQWDTNAYYNPTNAQSVTYPGQIVDTNSFVYYNVAVPPNAVAVNITITANKNSHPFPSDLPIYAQQSGYPDPVNAPGSIDITTHKDGLFLPPDWRGAITDIQSIQGSGFNFAVGNSTNVAVNYDLTVQIFVTNNVGDRNQVLEGMNDSLGGYYRYETGTSMAAADVSGVLALLQDYFTNKLSLTPSPALLKAVLINGSRAMNNYAFAVTNGINFQGWGLDNIQNCVLASGITNQFAAATSSFFVDQSVANALATGDSHTYIMTLDGTNTDAQYYQMQATLVWTDPPGDPAAAIKLVNNLDLVITNLDTGDVYFGNDISPDLGYNKPWGTNGLPHLDTVNNVENIFLPPLLAGSYSVTVVGRAVNVNAVTAQTNNAAGVYAPNVVQDYALVISIGEGEVSGAFTMTDNPGGIVSNPTGAQNLTVVTTTNTPLFNQMVGASSPLLGTNTLPLGSHTVWGSDGVVTAGMTNQWHFYIVTNTGITADYTNAAFITFDPYTLSIPRVGVFADDVTDATRPEADIDLYVSTDPSITNLNPVAISNCLAGVKSSGCSLGQGGTEFVFYTNSVPVSAGVTPSVYYVGVKSEDQMASEYAFMPVFTATPFSSLNANGDQVVNGLVLPMNIPDGDNAHPGVATVFALAVMPMTVESVTVTNLDEHQNFGDLFGALTFSQQSVVLNNHDGLGNTYGTQPLVYDDSVNPVTGTLRSDGPGSLVNFRGKTATGPWILNVMDNALTQTGQVSQLTLLIHPHRDLTMGITNTIPAHGWFIDYVDVPAGYTNLTFSATNLAIPTTTPAVQMYERLGNEPTTIDYDQRADLTNSLPDGTDPGNSISVGPPLPMGQYFVGLYNPSDSPAEVYLIATLGLGTTVNDTYDYPSGMGTVIPDDATNGSIITVPMTVTQVVASVNVGLVIQSPRISDYTFTLVSPGGTRVLLMENRGGGDTNGAGGMFVYTNILNSTATGGAAANTNYLAVDPLGGTVPITYNFYTVVDEMTVFSGTNNFSVPGPNLLWNTGFTNNPPTGSGAQNTQPETILVPYPPGISNITIIMNEFGNPYASGGDDWIYTAGAAITNYEYLMFTDDTNLATVPIKFAEPPYSLTVDATNFALGDFNLATNGDYLAPTNIYDAFGGWTVPTNLVAYARVFNLTNNQFQLMTNVTILSNNLVSVVADSFSSLGGDIGDSNYLALANGTITRSIATLPGRIYNVTFWYRGPGIAGWWRGEGDATDSSDPETNHNNGRLVGRFDFPAGEVDQAFQFQDQSDQFEFAGTNTYVQIPQSPSLDVGKGGGFTVEGWINPTNLDRPQPLVEWLARVPTNAAVTNIIIQAGPYLDRATGHYYYLLGATNWTVSENWAVQLGGHLVTLDTANEQNWVYDNFANYGGTNRNLWIGLTNTTDGQNFIWSSGLTNGIGSYTNWLTGQPTNCDGSHDYAFMRGDTNLPSGLWVLANNDGFVCGSAATNTVYGVVEVDQIQTNGVQFWISVTNTPGTTNLGFFSSSAGSNGCLYANIVDTNFVSHEIYSAPGLLQSNVYQHVALTFNTNSGIAALYLNGTNVAVTNLFTNGVSFVPRTDGDLLLGRDLTLYTNNYYGGQMDEMSLYSRALSDAEIIAIYNVSASTTNRLIGKFDPRVTPAVGLAEAAVVFGSASNVIFGVNDQWRMNSYTFTATSNSMPLRITGLEPGILLDSFNVSEVPLTNLCYLPEQALESLTGVPAAGDWTLQVWDNRAGAFVTNVAQLVNWQLSFVLESNALISATLDPQTPSASTVAAGSTVYYQVNVPAWAQWATNILVSSSQPVDLLFNPTNAPTGANPGGLTLLTASTGGVGTPVLTVNQPSPLAAGQAGSTYYLGVANTNTHAASVVLEVDYDITGLTNNIPLTSALATNETVRYFSFDVSTNAIEASFQLLQLSGNADLVVRKGVPLPTLTSSSYGSFNTENQDENIYVLTNSLPVPLTAGRWYLGVIKRDSGAVVNYSVLAKELDVINTVTNCTVINLTNNVPFNWTAGPGAALTNFFHFAVTNMVVNGVTNQGLRFELYNLSGNGDLTVQTNLLPLAPPFFQTSQNPGRGSEMIFVATNSALTNLVADWYLGVPNLEVTNISYTIIAEIMTNSYFPAFPGAAGAGGSALGGGHAGTTNGTVYHVTTTSDSGPGSLRAAVSAAHRTVVFDLSGTINLTNVLVITNSYLTIAGQTAPGGGITVAGQMTTVNSAHDVVIRDVRFRRGTVDDSLMLTNVANVIADHVSAEWSDTALSTLNSSNVTVQWSIMADSLYPTNNPPPLGSPLRYGYGALSFHHNLYADNYSGSPRLGDNLTLDFVNNVIYNWGTNAGYSLDDSGAGNPLGFTNLLNYACNYLIAGSNSVMPNIAFRGGTTNTWIFQTNNFIDSNTNWILDGGNTQWAMFTNPYTPFGRPFPVAAVPTDEAFLAYEKVLDFAGPAMTQRDPVDTNIVYKVRTQTGTLISTPVPSGKVAWWKAQNNALDSAGTNNGVASAGVTYGPGVIGNAFVLNGTTSQIIAPASASLAVSSFTMEGWVNPTQITTAIPIGEYAPPSGRVGPHLWLNVTGPGSIYANIRQLVPVWGDHPIQTANNIVPSNKWSHIALTLNQTTGDARIYLNGALVASQNLGIFTPGTSVPFNIGYRPTGSVDAGAGTRFPGKIDELSIYNRSLSASEIAGIYHAGNFAASASASLSYLDTDQDGIPDFWEDTFTTNLVFTPSNNNDRDGDGYTDLEEYNNWLAGPHALTVTNTPVGMDLVQLCGQTGNLSFAVTNAINGTVSLTNVFTNVLGSFTNVVGSAANTSRFSNSIAVFMPTNNASGTNFNGYASFDLYVTNNDTLAWFGPVTVKVVVSAVPVAFTPPVNIIGLTNNQPYYDPNTGGTDFYSFDVEPVNGTNAIAVLFTVSNATAPVTLVVNYGLPLPSLSSCDYISTSWTAGESILVTSNSLPVPLANGLWYLGVVNVSGGTVDYNVMATAYYNIVPPVLLFPTNTTVTNILETVPFTVSCVATDLDTPPLPLTFSLVNGPTNVSWATNVMTVNPTNGVINWTPNEAQGPSTNLISIAVANGVYSVTNTFKLIVDESNLPPVLPVIPNQLVIVGDTLMVTNTATDPDIPTNALGYTLTSTVTGTNTPNIDTNGIITWTPTLAQAGANYLFTTVVTDTNPWAVNAHSLSDTKSFSVTVLSSLPPGPPLTNVVAPNGTNWYAIVVPTNAVYATNNLWFATLPVNIWYSTNLPPSTDHELLANVTNGISVLNTNLASAPTNIVPGGVYFIGIQNTNSVPVTNAFEVDFGYRLPPVLPVIPDQVITIGDTLMVTNTATDTDTNAVLVYVLSGSGASAGAVISTNGIITWTPAANQAPTNVVITTIVTDTHAALSATNSFTVTVLPNASGEVPTTNIVAPHSINWFTVNVPKNADWATNILVFATAPVNFWYSTNRPPTITNSADVELLVNATTGSAVMGTNSTPRLVPGSRYYLGVQNTNNFAVTTAVQVKFHLVYPQFSIASLVQTNIAGTNGWMITWYAPTNDQFHLLWTPTLVPAAWHTFNGVISCLAPNSATNGLFQYFDNGARYFDNGSPVLGSPVDGLDAQRFYRLQLLNSPTNTPPFFLHMLTNTPPLFLNPLVTLTVTNQAGDWDIPAQALTYFVTNSLAGTNVAVLGTNAGVILWTPTLAQGGLTNVITTIVTDSGVPAKSVTNSFTAIVNPLPPFSSITLGTNGVNFQWTAFTNEQFQIRWTTNLVPPVSWTDFTNVITSTSGVFNFVDTNAPLLMKFYELILLP
jgi:subtilisin-like proprotein convertase family protein